MRATRRVVAAGRHVRTDQLERQQRRKPSHDPHSLVRIDAVAGPDSVGVLEHAEVDPCATGRTRLDLKAWVAFAQLRHQPVSSQGLIMDCGSAGPRSAAMHRVGDIAIVVPLDVADAVLANKG